jgi:hypothetical protein
VSRRSLINLVSALVISLGAFNSANSAAASVRMCGAANSCGICCYGSTYEDLRSCCLGNGCYSVCELYSSGCCLDGYQLNYPAGCY